MEPVSTQPGHQLKDIELIPLELTLNLSTPKENPYVEPANVFTLKKAQTMQPPAGINREDDR